MGSNLDINLNFKLFRDANFFRKEKLEENCQRREVKFPVAFVRLGTLKLSIGNVMALIESFDPDDDPLRIYLQ